MVCINCEIQNEVNYDFCQLQMAEKVEHLSATMAEYQQDQANKQREIQQLKTANAEKAARMVRNACRV